MEIRPIKTKRDYAAALNEIERLFDAMPGTVDGYRLEVLTALLHVYEEKHHAEPLPNPIDAIQYYMESRGLTCRDLEKYIGSRIRVSEVLNRKRAITMELIRNLHRGLGILAEVLIQPYRTGKDGA
jgi:HTH-type transcriptional regulator / antitoxin HigA